MKLASLKDGRDGRLLVVSRDLQWAVEVPQIALTMQAALDNWSDCEPALRAVAAQLEQGDCSQVRAFDPRVCSSPLPRAYHWADGSAYVNHVELVRRARGAELPDSFWSDPLIYQGGSDCFVGPCDPIVADPAGGIDFEAEIAVITGDVAMGVDPLQALDSVRLLMLVNDVSLRQLIPGELAKGFGFYQSKPASAFSPVAVTPDELAGAWQGGRVCRPLLSTLNAQPFGRPQAGEDMTFHFGQLIAHACRTREMGAGAIIGSGTVSNKQGTAHGSAIADGGRGYSCIAELRMIETIRDGQPATAFMQPGDQIRIEMLDQSGASIFGAIEQTVQPPAGSG